MKPPLELADKSPIESAMESVEPAALQHQLRQRAATSLFRIIWRWHFYAGMIVGPVLIVIALTGALYLFKDEIEDLANSGIAYSASSSGQSSYEQQIDSAAKVISQSHPDLSPAQVTIFSEPSRTTQIMFRSKDGPLVVQAYVDPYDARVVGIIRSTDTLPWIFSSILSIHRRLYAGTTGRVIVELVTCWTVILMATGLFLWWPRKWHQIKGVWIPRWNAAGYTVLRDLHALTGMYLVPIIGLIAITGLWYTFLMGAYGKQFASNLELGKPLFESNKKAAGEKSEADAKSKEGAGERKHKQGLSPSLPLKDSLRLVASNTPESRCSFLSNLDLRIRSNWEHSILPARSVRPFWPN